MSRFNGEVWNYLGWTSLDTTGNAFSQDAWNATILTSINIVGFSQGIKFGDELLVVVPKHLAPILKRPIELVKNTPGIYKARYHFTDLEDDIIEVSGGELHVINYNKE